MEPIPTPSGTTLLGSLDGFAKTALRYGNKQNHQTETSERYLTPTGTNTDRRDCQRMIADVGSGEFDAAVVKPISRIAHSNHDLDKTVCRFTENETGTHFVDEPAEFAVVRIDGST